MRALVAVIAGLCLAVGGPGPAQAGFPGANGRIAVATDSSCSLGAVATVFG